MTNHRVSCHYCKQSVLSRDIGKHLLKLHCAQMFVGDSLKNLHREKFLTRPLEVYFDTDPYFLCLSDDKCIRKEETARQHFKTQSPDLHKSAILRLREEYPLGSSSVSESASAGMTRKQKKALEQELNELLSKLRDFEAKANLREDDVFFFSPSARQALSSLDITLKEEVPETETETPALVPPEDDVLPLVEEKPVTKEQLIKQTLADPKFVKEISTNVLTGEVHAIPELQALLSSSPAPQKRGVKPVTKNPLVHPTPPPPPPPPVVPSPPAPPALDHLAEIERFQKMSPWERFLKSNPTLSVQEQLQVAQSLGIRPDDSSPFKIVQNSKLKRPIKLC